ncbi:hypothetical protein CRG98_005134 [Punica granatum]|uniref:Uncharacterized protein n=1 Tax=Punica granatum TaxID=22663 RepID=A0A2I0L162_PUNGR|nr:hypothetical protein CRG98_005134 [Punica granatum]
MGQATLSPTLTGMTERPLDLARVKVSSSTPILIVSRMHRQSNTISRMRKALKHDRSKVEDNVTRPGLGKGGLGHSLMSMAKTSSIRLRSEVVSSAFFHINYAWWLTTAGRSLEVAEEALGWLVPTLTRTKEKSREKERNERKGRPMTSGPEGPGFSFARFGCVRSRMWTLVGAHIAHFWIARLGSVHLPGDA